MDLIDALGGGYGNRAGRVAGYPMIRDETGIVE
jgi:hypothetical protein